MTIKWLNRYSLLSGSLLLTGAASVMVVIDLPPAYAAPSRPPPPRLVTPSHSTTIALTSDNARVVTVNRIDNSISVIQVRAGIKDVGNLLAKIPVGKDPRCVALSPNGRIAYVTNSVSGTISVVDLNSFRQVGTIGVGVEPRGCAITPNGKRLFVAEHTRGAVAIINPVTRRVIDTVTVGGNPNAVAITNDRDNQDGDERVFVTDFYARLIPGGPGEAFDTGKQGIVNTFTVANPHSVKRITLSPLANSGFTADRTNFCSQTIPAPNKVHSNIFCPDPNAAPGSAVITADPQSVYPNQFFSAVLRGNRLFLPNIGAQPEPPVKFNVNVQGLVDVVDTGALKEVKNEHVNLNTDVLKETPPSDPTASLAGLFLNQLVAADANLAGNQFLLVSQGGDYAVRASRGTSGKLTLNPPDLARFQTGHLPNGVVMTPNGARAYVYNEVGLSVTAINLNNNSVIKRDIPAGVLPAPGTAKHAVLVGKIAFFTALGIPDNGIFSTPIRAISTLANRGKASSNGWSSCASCHPDGLADGVTWIFAAGPRQSIPLDSTFAKNNIEDQRVLNWSAVRSSVTDFNNNSRGVQGGCGFASDDFSSPGDCIALGAMTPANPDVFDHGISTGASDALDAQTLWVAKAVRALRLPISSNSAAVTAGRQVFATNCASCHGGVKWTKSEIFYDDNPAFTADPALGGVPIDPGVTNAKAQIVSFTAGGLTFKYLENVKTFDVNDPLEINAAGLTAAGELGFNVPSLLSTGFHAPYLHNGEAQSLGAVFPLHALGNKTIATKLSLQQQRLLLVFLKTIDDRTKTFRSQGDAFGDATGLP